MKFGKIAIFAMGAGIGAALLKLSQNEAFKKEAGKLATKTKENYKVMKDKVGQWSKDNFGPIEEEVEVVVVDENETTENNPEQVSDNK